LLDKSINFLKKNNTDPKLLNGCVCWLFKSTNY